MIIINFKTFAMVLDKTEKPSLPKDVDITDLMLIIRISS